MAKPFLSIIIVAYNGKAILPKCLASIGRQRDADIETIVVDNASSDGTPGMVRKRFPFVKLIALDENTGFAQGNNIGIAKSQGKHVFFLNQDTELPGGAIGRIIAAIREEEDADVGMWAFTLVKPGKEIDTIGFKMRPFQLIAEIKDERDIGKIYGPSGGAAVYRRATLDGIKERTGFFDSRLFMFVEDIDLAMRAREKGWKVKHIPVPVKHIHGASTRDRKTRTVKDPFVYLLLRNRILVYRKTHKGIALIPYALMQAIILARYALGGKGRIALDAIRDGFAMRILPPQSVFSKYR